MFDSPVHSTSTLYLYTPFIIAKSPNGCNNFSSPCLILYFSHHSNLLQIGTMPTFICMPLFEWLRRAFNSILNNRMGVSIICLFLAHRPQDLSKLNLNLPNNNMLSFLALQVALVNRRNLDPKQIETISLVW